MFMKLFIFGGPGSGKTTMAKKISSEFNLPFFELDKLLYKKVNNVNQKTEEKERLKLIKKFIYQKEWITEGVYSQDWLDLILKEADIVAVLIVPKIIRNWRTTKRTVKRMIGLEKSAHSANLKLIFEFFKFNNEFEKERYSEFNNRLNRLKIKPLFIRNYDDLENIIKLPKLPTS